MREITLTVGLFALVDDADFYPLVEFNWYAIAKGNTFYAVRNALSTEIAMLGGRKHLNMHASIAGYPGVDHIDHNGLNNQRINLRASTQQQQLQNTQKRKGCSSQFKGVTLHKASGKWTAQITANNKHLSLGYYFNEVDAAKAYDEAARKYFGEFAFTNEDAGLLSVEVITT